MATQNLIEAIKNGLVGENIDVHFLRSDRLYHVRLSMQPNQNQKLVIKPVEAPTMAEQAFFRAWTGNKLQPEPKTNDSIAQSKNI